MLPYPAEGRLRKRYARPINMYGSIPVNRPKVQVFRDRNGRAVSGNSGPSSIRTPSNIFSGTNLRLARLESTAGTQHFHDAAEQFATPRSSLGGTPTYADASENYSLRERMKQVSDKVRPYAEGVYDVATDLRSRMGRQMRADVGNILSEAESVARDGVLTPFGIAAGVIAPELPGALAGAGKTVGSEVAQFAGQTYAGHVEAARVALGVGGIAATASRDVAGILSQAAMDAAKDALSGRSRRQWTEQELAYMRDMGITPEQAEAQMQAEQTSQREEREQRSVFRLPSISMPGLPSFRMPTFGRRPREQPTEQAPPPSFSEAGGPSLELQSNPLPPPNPIQVLFSLLFFSSLFYPLDY